MIRSSLRSASVLVACVLFSSTAHADIGSSMVTFLQGKLGIRVGGGECSQMATEALRANGGEFIPHYLGVDNPSSGDYVWGTLVTVISYSNKTWSDSNPSVACLPGDLIQYCGGAKIGTTTYPTHHTSVVKTVNSGTAATKTAPAIAARPTAVYQQNFNLVRTVQSATIDTTKLIAGSLRIYRPNARSVANDLFKITIVNNASTSQTVKIMVGTSGASSLSFTAANTGGSFMTYYITTTGTVPCLVLSDGVTTIYLQDAKGNNIYNPTSTTVGVQQLNP